MPSDKLTELGRHLNSMM